MASGAGLAAYFCFLLVGVENRGDALGIGGEGLDAVRASESWIGRLHPRRDARPRA